MGDVVAVDDVLCEVETDKATMDVPSPVAGTLLAAYFQEGDDVPVMTTIAAVGAAGEDAAGLAPAGATAAVASAPPPNKRWHRQSRQLSQRRRAHDRSGGRHRRGAGRHFSHARHLAERKGIDPAGLAGSGPGGRVIERDVQAGTRGQPKLTPVAKAMVAEGGYSVPGQGSGPGGRRDQQRPGKE